MPIWTAIAVYRCEVAGIPTTSLDIVARQIRGENIEAVEQTLFAEPTVVYENDQQERVEWFLACVPSINEVGVNPDDDELAGFIADLDEFRKWSNKDT